MSAPINDGGPAFPRDSFMDREAGLIVQQNGMCLRDYFAGQALAGEASTWQVSTRGRESEIAATCYAIADAMIAAREGRAE